MRGACLVLFSAVDGDRHETASLTCLHDRSALPGQVGVIVKGDFYLFTSQ